MTKILTLVVLIIFIGAFIVKFGELFLALAKVLSYFAVPLSIVELFSYYQNFFRRLYELHCRKKLLEGNSCGSFKGR